MTITVELAAKYSSASSPFISLPINSFGSHVSDLFRSDLLYRESWKQECQVSYIHCRNRYLALHNILVHICECDLEVHKNTWEVVSLLQNSETKTYNESLLIQKDIQDVIPLSDYKYIRVCFFPYSRWILQSLPRDPAGRQRLICFKINKFKQEITYNTNINTKKLLEQAIQE
jgi:hypothetical protein